MLNRLVVALFVIGTLSAGALTTLYVSPQGNDTNPGTRQRPFASVFRARDAIRKLKDADGLPGGGVVVEIAGGRYDVSETFELTADDSGAAGKPVVYRCDPEARAWLVAGQDIPVSALEPLTDPDIRARIPRGARPHVRCLDLEEAGVRFYTRLPNRFNCWAFTRRYPEELGYKPEYGYEPGRWTPVEVFCDGRELTPARWPNRDHVRIDEVVDNGEGFCRDNVRGGTFTQPSLKEKLKLWASAEELILNGYFFRDYFGYSVRVGGIDLDASTITLSHGLLDKKHKPHQRFYVHHLPEELDVPGEWYLKRATGLLCVWPPEGARTLTFPVLTDTMVRLKGASHVTIRGLGLEGGRHHALEVTGGESNRIVACDIRNVGRDGVLVKNGRDHRVLGCDIHHTGHAGVRLEGGDRKTLMPSGHVAENNHIHHTSRLVRNYSAPLYLGGVGNRASRNLIHDIPHIAVCFWGNEHVMEFNEIFSVLYETNEAGIFYTGRDWTARGNIIRYNFMHHVTGVPDWGVNFVHLDDSASGTEIHGNVCYKLEKGVSICGGHENKVHDNLFVECLNTVTLTTRGIDMFESDGKGGFAYDKTNKSGWSSLTRRLLACKWNEPPYSTRYPKLVEIFTKDPIAAPWWNEIQRNIAVDCDQHVRVPRQAAEWECVVEDNWSGEAPGFIERDHTRLDFRFRPDSDAYMKVGFQPIPFDKISVYASPDRATWPVTCERPPAAWKPRWLLRKELMSRTPVRVFPVADIKKGRSIAIDGAVNDDEWSPPGYDGSEPNRHRAATIEFLLNGDKDACPSTAYIETDGEALLIAFINDIDPALPISQTHRWGQDDAVEVALAVTAPPEAVPGKERPFIFRGYPDGHFEGSMESGWMEQEVSQSMQGVQFGAKVVGSNSWTAEFRIPFAAFAFNPANENRPVLVNLTVHKAAGKSWVQWKNRKGYSWEVHGSRALWLKPFGALPYLPGCRPAHARIDIQMMPGTPEQSFETGPGVNVANWSKDGNRLTANFGTVRGNRWRECRFEFTSRVDGDAKFELMGSTDAWTYYDNFQVDGAEFANPDFELDGDDGAFPGWSLNRDQKEAPVAGICVGIVRPPDGAASGLRVARTSHDRRVVKMLKLKQGQKVTVVFQARQALPVTPE
ncbi:MAG: hypothetical protein HN742_29555 [Lentisphaerae bacterium]|jgi:hypothetical protein|nr:hypothetical protein [Lentisphaerota bacterium]MBT7055476.1 hypothetical protein [Lentisphaerota bacterium]MBT7846055.1 hypothetical protein [Lentisphaerota bacterium]